MDDNEAFALPAGARLHGLDDGSRVDMAVEGATIGVRHASPRKLRDLIERITPENRHDEQLHDMTESERW